VLLVDPNICPALSSDHLRVLLDTTGVTSFQNLFDWVSCQACVEDRLPGILLVMDEVVTEKGVEELTSAIQAALAAYAPKLGPSVNTRPPLPVTIQDEIRLKNRLKRQWQATRDPAMKTQVNPL